MLKILIMAISVCFASTTLAADQWMSIPAPAEMPKPVESGTIPVNGIEMYYATYGSSETTPILMIHGGLAHADIWSSQVADLSKDYRVIVADTRGHGRSTNDGSDYSIELLAKDYVALLDKLGVENVHLVGWSDGANIGYEISKTTPDRLASHFGHAGNVTLAGVDPGVEKNEVFGSYVGMMAGMYKEMSPTPDGFDGFVGAISKMWFSDKADGMELVKAIHVPTAVVHSQYDEAILQKHSEEIATSIPGAEFVMLKDLSHFAMLQDPASYTAAIRTFIGKQ